MQELYRIVEEPRPCSYLPEEAASLEVRLITSMTPAEYADLLSRGYRRFGWQVFRPACRACNQCRSIRIPVQQFEPGMSERRILRKNVGIRAELCPLFVSREHVALYNLYHQFMHEHRGWPLRRTSARDFAQEFLSGAYGGAQQWLYFEDKRLVGVSLMDEAPGAISLIYFFYDPAWRDQSPGTFSILNQVRYAKSRGLEYAYLGYWIDACQSMSYKGRFHPRQILERYPAADETPVWLDD
ncbi:MAG TPA: arginyltransferase [Bryobacteraceae bacterium]|jgi:arginine-tRNA-protein transferase